MNGNFLAICIQVLYEQFKFFLNLYFLLMALSQFVPDLRLGYLYTYWGPLVRKKVNRIMLEIFCL